MVKKEKNIKNIKKLKFEEEIQEGEIVETQWDIKKIAIGLVILAVLFIIGSYIFFPKSESNNTDVLGAADKNVSTSREVPPLPNKQDVQEVIENAQTVLSQITSDNLTSSQAAIQKIITDLKTLQGNKDAIGAFCNLMCKDK